MTAQTLLSDLQALGVTLEAHGDQLRFHPRSAVGPDMLARLRDCRAELLEILTGAPLTADPEDASRDAARDARPQDRDDDLAGWREMHTPDGRTVLERSDWTGCETIDPPDPCPTCGSITRWQDGTGRWRCPTCDPPSGIGARLRAAAQAIRARHPMVAGERQLQMSTGPTVASVAPPEIVEAPVAHAPGAGRRRCCPSRG